MLLVKLLCFTIENGGRVGYERGMTEETKKKIYKIHPHHAAISPSQKEEPFTFTCISLVVCFSCRQIAASFGKHQSEHMSRTKTTTTSSATAHLDSEVDICLLRHVVNTYVLLNGTWIANTQQSMGD